MEKTPHLTSEVEQELVQGSDNWAKIFGAEAAERLKFHFLGWFLLLASYKQLGLVVTSANKWSRCGLSCSKSCHYRRGRRQKPSWWGWSWVVLLPRDCLDWESCGLMVMQRSSADEKRHPEKNLCREENGIWKSGGKRCSLEDPGSKKRSCRSEIYRISQIGMDWFHLPALHRTT